MTGSGERKSALLLASLRPSDRSWLFSRLSRPLAGRLRELVGQLEAMPLPAGQLAQQLLADEEPGTPAPGVDAQRLAAIIDSWSPDWAARALAARGGFDARYCLSLMDAAKAAAIEAETARAGRLPRALAEALCEEVRSLARLQDAGAA